MLISDRLRQVNSQGRPEECYWKLESTTKRTWISDSIVTRNGVYERTQLHHDTQSLQFATIRKRFIIATIKTEAAYQDWHGGLSSKVQYSSEAMVLRCFLFL